MKTANCACIRMLAGLIVLISAATVVSPFQSTSGLVVEEVTADSVAAKAGLKVGDRILSYDGKPVPSPAALQALQENTVGNETAVCVGRGEETLTLPIPRGKLGITVRPKLPSVVLDFYQQGKAKSLEIRASFSVPIQESMASEAIVRWIEAARLAEKTGDRLVGAWLRGRVAQLYEDQRQWKNAIAAHEAAWEVLRETGDPAARSQTLSALGRCNFNLNNFTAAAKWYDEAYKTDATAGNLMGVANDINELGAVASHSGNLQAAQDYFSWALAIHEQLGPGSVDHARSLNNLGEIFYQLSELDTAQNYLNRALAIAEQLAPDSIDVATSLQNLGKVAYIRGDFNVSQDYHNRALVICERLVPVSLVTAESLNGLGSVARERGDFNAAEEYNRRALAIREQLAPDSLLVAKSLNNLGNVSHNRGDLNASQEYHSRSLVIKERLARFSLDVAFSLNNLGSIAEERGELNVAQEYHSRALAIYEQLAPDSRVVAGSLWNLGIVAQRRGDLHTAQNYYTRALAIKERLAPESLDVASILADLGYLSFKEQRFQDAQRFFARAVSVVEIQRNQIQSLEGRSLLLAQRTAPYTGLLRSYLALNDLPAAFATLERARARSLVELLSERRLNLLADVPAELKKEQEELDQDRSIDSAALINADNQLSRAREEMARLDPNRRAEKREQLRERVEQVNRLMENLREKLARYPIEQRKLEREIRRASPNLAALQYPEPLELRNAQAALESGTLLLSYYLDDNETYLFAVTRTRLKLLTLPIGRKGLYGEVSLFHEEAAKKRLGNSDGRGQKLYDLLIRPAQDLIGQAKRILICPDGPLYRLPFAALVSQTKPTLRYFIDDKPLHTIVSMTIYAETRERTAVPARKGVAHRKRILALGDAIYTNDNAEQLTIARPARIAQLIAQEKREAIRSDREIEYLRGRGLDFKRLKYARREVQEIGRLFSKSASIRLDEQATETAIRKESNEADILHFAVHSWLDDQIGLNSALVLSRPEGLGRRLTKDDNGFLQAWEIFEQIRLNADLVVLSACDTGLGAELKGEGLIGLTRAFQYAGAKSIIVSLWGVNDESTSVLMGAFYRELRKGTTKDVALQRAMTAVRRNPKWRHPYYWSPFVLVGSWN